MMLHGIIPVFKPKGCTSHDVVSRIRRLVGQKRVGHTGTLDPEVDGVLPTCLGQATRLVEYLQALPKSYAGTMVLGIATETEDQTGEVIEQTGVGSIVREQVKEAFAQLTGTIEQMPPMYSAVKVEGRPLYAWAREGKTVARKKRTVEIYHFDFDTIRQGTFPEIDFSVSCSKGTYIRTLCVDVGRKLGFPAHMSSLTRTHSGPFYVHDCVTLEELEQISTENAWEEVIFSIDEVLGHLPSLLVANEEINRVYDGWELFVENYAGKSSLVRVYSEAGKFCALYQLEDTGEARAEKVFRDV